MKGEWILLETRYLTAPEERLDRFDVFDFFDDSDGGLVSERLQSRGVSSRPATARRVWSYRRRAG